MKVDLLIRDAFVIDGTSQRGFKADVAVTNSRIAAIGRLNIRAKDSIDARGLTLIPGIIDPHSHADLIFPLKPRERRKLLACKVSQGITTTIIGNCGLGCAPVTNGGAVSTLRAINSWMTPKPLAWDWRTVGDYLNRLDADGLPLNVASLIPHGPVRISVMALQKGAPTRTQMKEMRRLVDEAMSEGAVGLSSGLIYPPGMYSDSRELEDLAKIVATHDGVYTSHVRGSSETLVPAVRELVEIGEKTGVRVHHSHNEAVGSTHWKKIDSVIEMEEEAVRNGIRMSFDMFPYTAAATMMIAIYPPWALEGGVDNLIERLSDSKTRRRIEREIMGESQKWHNLVKATNWESISIGYIESKRNKKYENRNLAELGRLTGKSPFDAISDLIIEERGQVSMLIFEVSGRPKQADLLEKYVAHPLGAFCTDAEDYGRGRPHPAAYGSFPRILAKYVRNRKSISLEEAVRKMTSYPASIFGLKERGSIRPGGFADLVLFDPSKIRDRATFDNPRREARGISHVIINGEVAFKDGEFIDSSRGRVVRRDRIE